MSTSPPRTNGSDEQIVTYLLRHRSLVHATPNPVTIGSFWSSWLSVADRALVSTVIAKGQIDRADLLSLSTSGRSSKDLRQLFVATMMWGTGTANARMKPGFLGALTNAGLAGLLRKTANDVRAGLPGNGHQTWLASDIPGLGEPFFTKWLYAAALSHATSGSAHALVLDGRVWKSLGELGWNSERSTGFRYARASSVAYAAYCVDSDRWAGLMSAAGVPTASDQIEHFLFASRPLPP